MRPRTACDVFQSSRSHYIVELSTVKPKKNRKAYEKLEEPNHTNRTEYVGNGCHDCTKPHTAGVKHWPKEEGDEEEDK
jgi:hypothetical protein